MRDPGGVHLNPAGLALARRVGAAIGPFDRVETSPLPRAVETAVAMGWPGHATHPMLGAMGDRVDVALGPIISWGDYQLAVRRSPAVADYAERVAGLLGEIVGSLPEGGHALVVSHGGIVELSAVAAHPTTDWKATGETASYLEGVRLGYERVRCVEATVLRAPRR
jgi:broad specificity phosphatase PhoE